MELDNQRLAKMAKIAAIQLTEQEKHYFGTQLTHVTQWIEQLNEVDTTNTSPLRTMSVEINRFAEDTPKKPMTVSQALTNAPKQDGAYFHVPSKSKQPASSKPNHLS